MLEVNTRPQRDLRALIEAIGQKWVERELNVHRTTIGRWLDGKVQIPGRQHLAIRMLLGDLPGTEGKWHRWCFRKGKLVSPDGDEFNAGDVLSLIFLRQQLRQQQREIAALKVQLAMAEQALNAIGPAANDERAVG